MEPTKTISLVKTIALMEGDVHTSGLGYGFTGLILELHDGRILTNHSTDPMQSFSELKPNNPNYEQLKLLITN